MFLMTQRVPLHNLDGLKLRIRIIGEPIINWRLYDGIFGISK
jgi:hypothetical protein